MLRSAPGSDDATLQFVSSFLVNDDVAIDAGCLGTFGGVADQARVRHVFLSHSHADHVATLPIFVENVYDLHTEPVVVHGSAAVLDSLRRDIFNDRVWPDFIDRLAQPDRPFLTLGELHAEQPVSVCGLTITPVPVNHLVPTFAFVVDDGTAQVIFGADTGPTRRLWQVAAGLERLRAVFLEAAFPDEMRWLADLSGHMTPSQFADEVGKVPAGVPVVAVHLKPRYRRTTIAEIEALGLPGVSVGRNGGEWVF